MGVSLVYHGGALGDFLTALPAMAAWHRNHPEERVVLLGKPAFAVLAVDGLFDDVWDVGGPGFARLFSDGGAEAIGLDPLSSVSSALLFSSAGSALAANLLRLGARGIVRQEPFPPGSEPIVDYHLSLFDGLSFSEEERRPRITPGPAAVAVPPRTVALHPGSGSARKNWPLDRFASLSRRLERDGLRAAWIAGPAEETLVLPQESLAWRGLPLPHLAAALASCALYVGNDSGVTHLAAAAGCPTVALFGPSDARVWAPRGRLVRVVNAPQSSMEMLEEETVYEACCRVLRT